MLPEVCMRTTLTFGIAQLGWFLRTPDEHSASIWSRPSFDSFGIIDLSERPRVLKHQVVRSRLEELLEDLVEVDPFPAECELAESFSVSRETIRQALRELLPIPISSRTSRCRRRCTPNSRGAESISAERRTRSRPLFPTRAKHCYTSTRVRRCSCSSASRTTTRAFPSISAAHSIEAIGWRSPRRCTPD